MALTKYFPEHEYDENKNFVCYAIFKHQPEPPFKKRLVCKVSRRNEMKIILKALNDH